MRLKPSTKWYMVKENWARALNIDEPDDFKWVSFVWWRRANTLGYRFSHNGRRLPGPPMNQQQARQVGWVGVHGLVTDLRSFISSHSVLCFHPASSIRSIIGTLQLIHLFILYAAMIIPPGATPLSTYPLFTLWIVRPTDNSPPDLVTQMEKDTVWALHIEDGDSIHVYVEREFIRFPPRLATDTSQELKKEKEGYAF
jgi:hypothetical protein